MEPTTLIGIVFVVVGVVLAIRVAKTAAKLAFVAVVLIGLYLWFGPGVGAG